MRGWPPATAPSRAARRISGRRWEAHRCAKHSAKCPCLCPSSCCQCARHSCIVGYGAQWQAGRVAAPARRPPPLVLPGPTPSAVPTSPPQGSDQIRQAFSKRKKGLVLKSYQLFRLTDAKVCCGTSGAPARRAGCCPSERACAYEVGQNPQRRRCKRAWPGAGAGHARAGPTPVAQGRARGGWLGSSRHATNRAACRAAGVHVCGQRQGQLLGVCNPRLRRAAGRGPAAPAA
jgi:hypothetical protein